MINSYNLAVLFGALNLFKLLFRNMSTFSFHIFRKFSTENLRLIRETKKSTSVFGFSMEWNREIMILFLLEIVLSLYIF